jgi:hypothetical protein
VDIFGDWASLRSGHYKILIMIKLFRSIRQKHIMKNQTGKYLKYAIGEIILVVIGILLALQINNWNEQRKLANEEQKLLNALEKEVTSNINYLERT